MPSGISVHPRTTDAAPRRVKLCHHFGQWCIGIGHTVRLHQSYGGADEVVHLFVARLDAVPAQCTQAILIEPHRQRRLGPHDADPPAADAKPPELRGGGIDDMQDRQMGCVAHRVVPAVCGVAWDGDRSAAGPLKSLDAAQQPGQRIGTAAETTDRPVRHPWIRP